MRIALRALQTNRRRLFSSSSRVMSADPYTDKAGQDASAKTKVDEVFGIMSKVKTCMFTTRAADGALHSRAMAPATKEGLVFKFFANNNSGKFDEVESDGAANISFYDTSSTDWVSVSGKAKVSDDMKDKETLWNPITKAWFGDLGDGKHTGNYDDPRVSLIVVEPTEIRYWATKRTNLGQLAEIAKGAVTGETAAPGVLRVLNASELAQEKQRASV